MLCIKGGRLVSSAGIVEKDIWINDGKIAEAQDCQEAHEVYDATGCLIFPGFIDAHTHLEMESGDLITADDFPSGTAAALSGGTTAILDFATQNKGCSLAEALKVWHKKADGRSYCNYGFHMAVTDWNDDTRKELSEMVRQGVTSFKAYMAYETLRLTDEEILQLLEASRDLGCLVGVHCELGDEVVKGVKMQLEQGNTGPQYHPLSRPNLVESLAVRRFLELAKQANAPAWIVHLSTEEGMKEILEARGNGQKVLVETCPQYLTLMEEVYIKQDFEGAKFVCSPPIRGLKDVENLWTVVENNEVDIISTDHCSYNFAGQKDRGHDDFSKIPNGLPGIEHRPALIWSFGVGSGRITPQRMAELLSEKPAQAFGMYPQKGSLNVGSDADVVIWDPDYSWTLYASNQLQRVDYSPWEGTQLKGRAKAVFLKGELCAEEGKIKKGPTGEYIPRRAVW